MCRDCGCSLGPPAQRAAAANSGAERTETIEVITAILSANDQVAAHNREHFDGQGVLALNLMSSPGAGVTATESVSRSTTAPSVPTQVMSVSSQAGSAAGRLDSVMV
jgi:hydrogenase nickel incorporation protein HypB